MSWRCIGALPARPGPDRASMDDEHRPDDLVLRIERELPVLREVLEERRHVPAVELARVERNRGGEVHRTDDRHAPLDDRLTRPGETVVEGGVSIVGAVDLASSVPLHASQLYGRNVTTLLQHLAKDGKLALDPQDEIVRPMLVVHAGKVRTWSRRERADASPAHRDLRL